MGGQAHAAHADLFGQSVAIDGNTVVVGAYLNDDARDNSGSAYVFQRDAGGSGDWVEVAKFVASDGAPGDFARATVAISGDTAVVGAMHDDDAGDNSGAVYIFQRDAGGSGNWGQITKRTASDGAAAAESGASGCWAVFTMIISPTLLI